MTHRTPAPAEVRRTARGYEVRLRFASWHDAMDFAYSSAGWGDKPAAAPPAAVAAGTPAPIQKRKELTS